MINRFIYKIGINKEMINLLEYTDRDLVLDCRNFNAFRGLKVLNWIEWYIIWIRFVIIDGMWILQTVTLATYVFFIFTVIGRQKLDGIGIGLKTERMQSGRLPMSIDLYIPVYTILQFFFYMGLLKVRMKIWSSTLYDIQMS